MERFKEEYTQIVNNAVTSTYFEFTVKMRLAILSAKTTKNTSFMSDALMQKMLDKLWISFINDCENPKIGVTKAIDKVFKPYIR